MKIITLMLLIGLFNVSASVYSQQTKLNLDLKNATIEDVLWAIQEQSEFIFLYSIDDIDRIEPMNLSFEDASIGSVLDELLSESEITYRMKHNTIVFSAVSSHNKINLKDMLRELPQPVITITGTVTDDAGAPLPGVNVVIQGTILGTSTDVSGRFTINVPDEGTILAFSFIGFTSVSMQIGKQRNLSIILIPEIKAIEEVVVVGYGIQKKESVVGAITQATGEDIRQSVQGSNLTNALKGHMPGLITLQSTDIPGGYSDYVQSDPGYSAILIRGMKTWNEASPLILVDGVERSMLDINPYEIEKISILKDASATAVFGVKGANGVILITTNRGKEGKPSLTFDASFTTKTISRVPHTLGSYEANLIRNYAIINEMASNPTSWGDIVPQQYLLYYRDQTYPEYFPDVDWVDEMVNKWGYDKNVNLSASGGTSFVKYFTSLSYFNEGDMMKTFDYGQGYDPNYGYERINFRSNLDFDITPTTRFSANLSGFQSIKTTIDGGEQIWYGMNGRPPDLYPSRYSDGTWADYTGYDRFKNSYIRLLFSGLRKNKITNVTNDFLLNQKLDFLTPGLSARGKLSYDNTSGSRGPIVRGRLVSTKWIDFRIVEEIEPGMSEAAIRELERKWSVYAFPNTNANYDYVELPAGYGKENAESNVYRNLYYEFALNYVRDFGKHAVTGLGLMSRNEKAYGSEFTNYREDWVGRVTYAYDRRYLLELNAAYNGSEKFSRNYRFGFFPSIAGGWIISNEAFFSKLKPYVTTLKLRYSDGNVGSDAGIDRWLYVGSWEVTNYLWQLGSPIPQSTYPITYEGVIPNPDIQWEQANKKDFGIESGFFNNQLKINFDYFNEHRTNIFLTAADKIIPVYFGAPPIASNLGVVDVHGYELDCMLSKTYRNGLNFWLSYSLAYAKDKIIEKGDPELTPFYQKQAGYQINQTRIRVNQPNGIMNSWNDVYTGVLPETNAQTLPGNFHQIDFNNDGFINANDQVPWGYPTRPQYNYSPAFGFSYKAFSGNIRFYGVYNVRGERLRTSFYDRYNIVYPVDKSSSWMPELGNTTDAQFQALRWLTSGSSGTVFISRAYLKIQSAELMYNLSIPAIRKLGISNLNFRITGNNLFMWSDMTEDVDKDSNETRYPLLRRVAFGMSFNFQ